MLATNGGVKYSEFQAPVSPHIQIAELHQRTQHGMVGSKSERGIFNICNGLLS